MFRSNTFGLWKKGLCVVLSIALMLGSTSSYAQSAFVSTLPEPGAMVSASEAFTPILVKGLVVHPDKPLNFDFIVDSGNDSSDQAVVKEQSQRMAKYFLAALTVPESQLWVNLSPYEKDRVIEDELGQTVLGRDMLAQDYVLKQLTASMVYPEKGLGKEFWARVYKEAAAKFGTTDIPVDTFNKVWIMPDTAEVFEKGTAVYVTGAKLKVMLDSDYVAMSQQKDMAESRAPARDVAQQEAGSGEQEDPSGQSKISKQIMREVVLPAIEREVNEGRNFSTIRQVYHAAILAKWYRELIQNTLLANAYVGTNKVTGVESDEKALKEEIYQRYIAAYKKGVFDYVKEEADSATGEAMPRKYFSGGETFDQIPLARTTDPAMANASIGKVFKVGVDLAMSDTKDAAMREQLPSGRILRDYQANIVNSYGDLATHSLRSFPHYFENTLPSDLQARIKANPFRTFSLTRLDEELVKFLALQPGGTSYWDELKAALEKGRAPRDSWLQAFLNLSNVPRDMRAFLFQRIQEEIAAISKLKDYTDSQKAADIAAWTNWQDFMIEVIFNRSDGGGDWQVSDKAMIGTRRIGDDVNLDTPEFGFPETVPMSGFAVFAEDPSGVLLQKVSAHILKTRAGFVLEISNFGTIFRRKIFLGKSVGLADEIARKTKQTLNGPFIQTLSGRNAVEFAGTAVQQTILEMRQDGLIPSDAAMTPNEPTAAGARGHDWGSADKPETVERVVGIVQTSGFVSSPDGIEMVRAYLNGEGDPIKADHGILPLLHVGAAPLAWKDLRGQRFLDSAWLTAKYDLHAETLEFLYNNLDKILQTPDLKHTDGTILTPEEQQNMADDANRLWCRRELLLLQHPDSYTSGSWMGFYRQASRLGTTDFNEALTKMMGSIPEVVKGAEAWKEFWRQQTQGVEETRKGVLVLGKDKNYYRVDIGVLANHQNGFNEGYGYLGFRIPRGPENPGAVVILPDAPEEFIHSLQLTPDMAMNSAHRIGDAEIVTPGLLQSEHWGKLRNILGPAFSGQLVDVVFYRYDRGFVANLHGKTMKTSVAVYLGSEQKKELAGEIFQKISAEIMALDKKSQETIPDETLKAAALGVIDRMRQSGAIPADAAMRAAPMDIRSVGGAAVSAGPLFSGKSMAQDKQGGLKAFIASNRPMREIVATSQMTMLELFSTTRGKANFDEALAGVTKRDLVLYVGHGRILDAEVAQRLLAERIKAELMVLNFPDKSRQFLVVFDAAMTVEATFRARLLKNMEIELTREVIRPFQTMVRMDEVQAQIQRLREDGDLSEGLYESLMRQVDMELRIRGHLQRELGSDDAAMESSQEVAVTFRAIDIIWKSFQQEKPQAKFLWNLEPYFQRVNHFLVQDEKMSFERDQLDVWTTLLDEIIAYAKPEGKKGKGLKYGIFAKIAGDAVLLREAIQARLGKSTKGPSGTAKKNVRDAAMVPEGNRAKIQAALDQGKFSDQEMTDAEVRALHFSTGRVTYQYISGLEEIRELVGQVDHVVRRSASGKIEFLDRQEALQALTLQSRLHELIFETGSKQSFAILYGGISSSSSRDAAMNGGIDIQGISVIRKADGQEIKFDERAVRDVLKNGFNGFTPVIINITPVASPLMILGVTVPEAVPALGTLSAQKLSAGRELGEGEAA